MKCQNHYFQFLKISDIHVCKDEIYKERKPFTF